MELDDLCLWIFLFLMTVSNSAGLTDTEESPGQFHEARSPVFISEPPASVVFPNNKGVLIPCTVFGDPAPAMDWVYADGRVVDNITPFLQVLANNSLWLTPFEEENYRADVHNIRVRCMANNSAGTLVSRLVRIHAVLLNRFRTYNVLVNDAYVTRGNTAVLKCSIKPAYVRQYVTVTTWTNGGNDVIPGGRYSILNTGDLHIRDVTTGQDSFATYRCITKNVLTGEEKASDQATINVLEPWSFSPQVDEPLLTIRADRGSVVELPCVAAGYPLVSYSWSKDGDPLVVDQRRLLRHGGNLVIQTVGVRDSGTYTCLAENNNGRKPVIRKLVVTAPISAFISPVEQTVDMDKSATFNCSLFGHPIKTIRWYKDGTILRIGRRLEVINQTILHIRHVQRPDEGVYQCVVENEKDSAQAAAHLALGAAKPHVHAHFMDDYVKPMSTVSMMCSASGNPPPLIKWTLDDQPLPLNKRFSVGQFRTTGGDIITYVNITQVRVEDGGQYRCIASNKVGQAEHLGRLNVYGVPFIRPMRNLTAVAKEMLVIKCHVSGYPIRVVSWLRDGVTLPINHRQQVSKDGTLTIHDLDRNHDDGEYTCVASNTAGQKTSKKLFLHVLEPPTIDAFSFPKRKQGDRVSISCVVSSGDLPISISWQKDSRPIPHDLGVIIQMTDTYSSRLSIGLVNPVHNGNYTCTARNAAASTNHTAQLQVDVPPSWVLEPQDSFVILNNDVMIDCDVMAKPYPTTLWKKAKGDQPGDYRDIEYDDVRSGNPRVQKYTNGSLMIRQAGEGDRGYYLCQASNGVGTGLSKVIYLTVHVPARFEAREKNYTVTKGNKLNMACHARGDKPLSVAWSFNSKSIDWQRSDRFQVTYLNTKVGRRSQLSIPAAQRKDNGFFVCNAQNKFGSDSITIQLIVREIPEAPKNLAIKNGGSRSVVITWQPGFDGNSPLLYYVIQYKLTTDPWRISTSNVTAGPHNTTAVVSNIRPALSYNLRIMAKNTIGLSRPSYVVSYSATEEEPSGPPTNVSVVPSGSESLKVTWQMPDRMHRNGQILGYYIGYKKFNTSAPYMYITVRLGSSGDPLEYELHNLMKFTHYAVHAQAFNVIGPSPRSRDVSVFTLEDVPSQPPRDVQATPLSSQSILVVWSPPPLYTLHGILQGYKIIYKPVRKDEDEADANTVISSKLTTAIYGLEKYVNYSIEVLAYTRSGEGVRSSPIYVRTQQDYPERPSDIKATPAGPNSVLVSWRPPLHTNGVLLKYSLFVRDVSGRTQMDEWTLQLSNTELSHLVTNLSTNHKYGFRVGASTVVGEGELTMETTASPLNQVAARIASFATAIFSAWHTDVLLPCLSVGKPAATVTWKFRGQKLESSKRHEMYKNGSLVVKDISSYDAGNYTCRAENTHGVDEIKVSLVVQAPPHQPLLQVVTTTATSVQLSWRSGSNGGSKIQGFTIYYRREHSHWKSVQVSAHNRSYTATGLHCGTRYMFHIKAFNKVDHGPSSETVSAITNGSAPIMPPQSMIMEHINSTFVVIKLLSWLDGGCPLTYYDIVFQYWGDTEWHTVDSHVTPETEYYKVELRPETWYVMKVTAHNQAGSTECVLKFATKTYEGGTIVPVRLIHTMDVKLYENMYVMIPVCAVCVIFVVLTVGVGLYCRRRFSHHKYEAQNASNLRRDLTAETSLMSDTDKHHMTGNNQELIYTPDPTRHRNINLLISGENEEKLLDDTSSWIFQNSGKGEKLIGPSKKPGVGEEGSLNLYDTICYRSNSKDHMTQPKTPLNNALDDRVMLDESLTQREIIGQEDDFPPPPPEVLAVDQDFGPTENESLQNQDQCVCASPVSAQGAPGVRCHTAIPTPPKRTSSNYAITSITGNKRNDQPSSSIDNTTSQRDNHVGKTSTFRHVQDIKCCVPRSSQENTPLVSPITPGTVEDEARVELLDRHYRTVRPDKVEKREDAEGQDYTEQYVVV